MIFKSADGRELRRKDLKGVTGEVRWELIGNEDVPVEAQKLHERARSEGMKGNYEAALKSLSEAQKLAPRWPYPVYDQAWTFLLKGDNKRALEAYRRTLSLSPRGFFTAITAADCLKRESEGSYTPGLYKAFVMLEWMQEQDRKVAALKAMVEKHPSFGPGWKMLAEMAGTDAEVSPLLEKGLASQPDPETRGMLLISKALLLNRQGKTEEAVAMLGALSLDPGSPMGVEALSKLALSNIVK